MFNPLEIYRRRKRLILFEKDLREGIYNFEMNDGQTIRVDPLLTYVRLKELGLDVMSENIEGALKGKEEKTRIFLKSVCDAFGVDAFNQPRGSGLTVLDAFRLYLGFYRFLEALKKNITFLRDFAPSMEERLTYLTSRRKNDEKETEKLDEIIVADEPDANETPNDDSPLSDSTSISQTPPRSSDLASTTAQAAPSADSTSTYTKRSTDEKTNT
jgi:hypothetical protein